ncbi:MAG: hypothetical protein ACLRO3_17910 [Parabacteroides distasonis]
MSQPLPINCGLAILPIYRLLGGDVCYLHLVTDAYSHKIVGWVLADSLRASATLEALRQAIDQAVEMTGSENLEGPDTPL